MSDDKKKKTPLPDKRKRIWPALDIIAEKELEEALEKAATIRKAQKKRIAHFFGRQDKDKKSQ